jgi:hypothetical protein
MKKLKNGDTISYLPPYRNESEFEGAFATSAGLLGCRYFKIPDAIVFKGQKQITEHRRPFDGILSTPTGNIAIELKYAYNALELHQWGNLKIISNLNGKAFVCRFKPLKTHSELTIESPDGKVLFLTTNLEKLIEYLKETK